MKYDEFVNQIIEEKSLEEVAPIFEQTYDIFQKRSFFTWTYILGREVIILEKNIDTLKDVYIAELMRLKEVVLMNIDFLSHTLEESESYFFPEKEEIKKNLAYLQHVSHLERSKRMISLDNLATISTKYVQKAQIDLKNAKRNLLQEDSVSLKHEINFIDSVYRVHTDTLLVFDRKYFMEKYEKHEKLFENPDIDYEILYTSYFEIFNVLHPYRLESHNLRSIAREKRKDAVTYEASKWVKNAPPKAPITDIYSQIYVSLRDQKIYVFEDGELLYSTAITSGRRDFETVRGTFKVYTKQRNKTLRSPFPDLDYELWVDYWLGFYDAYGIHDACNSKDCWRTQFGEKTYLEDGSHGCVNTPYDSMKFLYNWTQIGTTVHVE